MTLSTRRTAALGQGRAGEGIGGLILQYSFRKGKEWQQKQTVKGKISEGKKRGGDFKKEKVKERKERLCFC